MQISKKNDKSVPEYKLGGSIHKTVPEVKDLGIYITSNLTWSLQATKCANKANSLLGFIKRTVGPKSLVRPILEYCSPVWSRHLKKDIDILEKVQRHASRFALGIDAKDMPYDERLSNLNICFSLLQVFNRRSCNASSPECTAIVTISN